MSHSNSHYGCTLPIVADKRTVGDILAGVPRPRSAPPSITLQRPVVPKSKPPRHAHSRRSFGSSVVSTEASLSATALKLRSTKLTSAAGRNMSLTARLFAYDLIKNTPNSELLRLLWELGKDRLSEHIFKHGARLGLRNVSVREFAALMESIFPKATLEQVDVEYVFAFLDWGGCGSVEFKVLVQSCRSLYASRNVVAVLCCRQLLYVKPLNDAVVTVGELDTMFSALQTLYASEVSVSVLRLCAEIKHLLLPYEVDYCFSAPLVQETFYRLPSFVALLERIEWDGRLRQSRGSLTRLTELVANERRDSQTAADAKKRCATRELYNKEVLNCYMDIYQGESKLEKSDDGKRYYNKKRLVCDRFMVRPDPTALMSE